MSDELKLRTVLGRPLTNQEVDGNFLYIDGRVQSATNVANAADSRASHAAASVKGKADQIAVPSEEIGGGLASRSGDLTWLQWRKSDGSLPDVVAHEIKSRLSLPPISAGAAVSPLAGVGGGMVDQAGAKADGGPPDDVIRMLRDRIGIGGLPGMNYRVHPSDGAVVPVVANLAEWVTWGSSSSWYLAPLIGAALNARYGASIYNGGVSGQGVESICARLGSHPAQLQFPGDTIPASGSVSVTSPNVSFYRFIDYYGVVAGVHGRIRRTTTAEDPLTFTRTLAGDPVTLSGPSIFVPDQGTARRADMTLLWMGKNDVLASGDTPSIVSKVVQYTDEAFDWLAPQNIRALVLGHFINRKVPAVSGARDQVNQINAAYKSRYGDLYIDVQGWLISSQVWIDLGITPTAQDLNDQAAEIIPQSLARDDAHLTDQAYEGIFTHLIAPRIESTLGWFTPRI